MRGEMNNEERNEEFGPTAAAEAALDLRLVRALEDRPQLSVDRDFAARVAAQVTPRRITAYRLRHKMSLTPRNYGRNMMIVCLLALAIAMVAIPMVGLYRAPVVEAVDWLLCAQFICLVAWLRWRWQRMSS